MAALRPESNHALTSNPHLKPETMPAPDPETLRRRLGEALQKLRLSRSITEPEVAHRMGEEPSMSFEISRWEQGDVAPPADKLWSYLDAIGASFAELGYELDPPEDNPRLQEILRQMQSLSPASRDA